MNKYVRKLFGVVFQSQQASLVVSGQTQHSPTSPEEWRQHWQLQGQFWRTEPEIDVKRQEELNRHRAIIPDIEKGVYPFRGMKLSRADIEWLLATHENGRGPVDWNNEDQWKREGLDLRGADLRGENLAALPLSGMLGSLNEKERGSTTEQQSDMARVYLEHADLTETHLERSILIEVHLEKAKLTMAHLGGSHLLKAHMERVILYGADAKQCDLKGAHLEGADLRFAHLEHALLRSAQLYAADVQKANLQNADLRWAHLAATRFSNAHLEGANLEWAHLEGLELSSNYLASLRQWMPGFSATLLPADLSEIFFDTTTIFKQMTLGNKKLGFVSLADVHWGGVSLTATNWVQMKLLGDEQLLHQQKWQRGKGKTEQQNLRRYQLTLYQRAVRANRQLAVVLEEQGLNEDSARFAFRAQRLQRKVLWKQREFGKWVFSFILALLAGYGYRMWHILVAYLFIVLLCAVAYFVLGMYYEPHLSFLEAVLTSITAFHGRVFSEPFLQPGDPQLWVTAFEAVAGLVIEGVFIAMLTQKFFGK